MDDIVATVVTRPEPHNQVKTVASSQCGLVLILDINLFCLIGSVASESR